MSFQCAWRSVQQQHTAEPPALLISRRRLVHTSTTGRKHNRAHAQRLPAGSAPQFVLAAAPGHACEMSSAP